MHTMKNMKAMSANCIWMKMRWGDFREVHWVVVHILRSMTNIRLLGNRCNTKAGVKAVLSEGK